MGAQILSIGASANPPENAVVADELTAGGASLAWLHRYAVARRRALDPFTRQQRHAALLQEFCRMDRRRFCRPGQNLHAGLNDSHGSSRPGLDDLAGHLDADRAAADNQDSPCGRKRYLEPTENRFALFDRTAQRSDQLAGATAAGRQHADVACHPPSSAIIAVHQATIVGPPPQVPV